MNETPHIIQLSAEEYHADPCPDPSLSSSIAKVIWQKSLIHAWRKHAKNPDHTEAKSAAFDIGTAVHSIVLEDNHDGIEVIEAKDWRTNAAKEARDDARAAGLIPLLAKELPQIEAIASSAQLAILKSELSSAFTGGDSEVSIVGKIDEIWQRGRLDKLSTDMSVIIDLKTTGVSARPDEFARRTLFSLGYDISAAMYRHLVHAITGVMPAYYWVVVETEAPYCTSIIGAGESTLEIGRQKLDLCVAKWRDGLLNGFAGYGSKISWADAPAWAASEIEERLYQEEQQS